MRKVFNEQILLSNKKKTKRTKFIYKLWVQHLRCFFYNTLHLEKLLHSFFNLFKQKRT